MFRRRGGRCDFDRNNHAVGSNYLIRVVKAPNGTYVPLTVGVIPNVDESFGGYFTRELAPGQQDAARLPEGPRARLGSLISRV